MAVRFGLVPLYRSEIKDIIIMYYNYDGFTSKLVGLSDPSCGIHGNHWIG